MKTVCIPHRKFIRGVRELTSVLLHPGWFWPCIFIMQYLQMHNSTMNKWLPDVRVGFSPFYWGPWTNSHVWTVSFLSVCMCIIFKNCSAENISNGHIRKNIKGKTLFFTLKNTLTHTKNKQNPPLLSFTYLIQAPPSFLPCRYCQLLLVDGSGFKGYTCTCSKCGYIRLVVSN